MFSIIHALNVSAHIAVFISLNRCKETNGYIIVCMKPTSLWSLPSLPPFNDSKIYDLFRLLRGDEKKRGRRRFGNSKREEREDWGKNSHSSPPPLFLFFFFAFFRTNSKWHLPISKLQIFVLLFRPFWQIILWEGVIVSFTFCSCFDLCLWTTGHEEKSFSFRATEEKEGGLGPTNQPIKTGPFHSPKKEEKGSFRRVVCHHSISFLQGKGRVCECVEKRRGKGTNTHSTFPANNILFVKKRFVRKLRWTSKTKKYSRQFSYLTVFLKLLSWQRSGWNWPENVSKPPIDASFEISTKKEGGKGL